MPLCEFRRRFKFLVGDFKTITHDVDDKKAVEDMLLSMDLDLPNYRVGLSQVSFVCFSPILHVSQSNFQIIVHLI